MTRTMLALYDRFHSLTDRLDQDEAEMKAWQVSRLHELAQEAEQVLSGCRRKEIRRG